MSKWLIRFVVLLAGSAVLTLSNTVKCEDSHGISSLGIQRKAEAATKARQWAEAAALWQKAVEANPYRAQGWFNLGYAYYEAHDYRQAIPAYARALDLGANFPFNSAYNIACCHALLGEKEEAYRWLQKSLDLGFRELGKIQKDNDFKSMRSEERFRRMVGLVDAGRLSREEGWRFDLALLVHEVRRKHWKPYRQIRPADFDKEVTKLHDDIPSLTDAQIKVRFRKLMASIGDGHTSIVPPFFHGESQPGVPLAFYVFQEGLFITDADPSHADLAGAQVLQIGPHPVDEVFAQLEPIISKDNSMGVQWLAPLFLRFPEMLQGLGLIPETDRLPLTILDAQGKKREITLVADAPHPDATWVSARRTATIPNPLYLKNRERAYWFEYLPESRIMYFQYNRVMNDGPESLEQCCHRLFQFIDEHDVQKLVVDMRWNHGGNNFYNRPLVHGLIRRDKINRAGKLFIIVSRNTFSAAMCGAANIERDTHAIFVGEPTGSRPNFVGESVLTTLPYSKLRASISDLYHQNSTATDFRTWIAPEIYVPATFSTYRANRDSALEAILRFELPQ